MQKSEVRNILEQAKTDTVSAKNIHELLHEIKPKYLGSEGVLSAYMAKLKSATNAEEKKSLGMLIKEIKTGMEDLFAQKLAELQDEGIKQKLMTEKVDGSLSVPKVSSGSIHPVTFVAKEMLDIFKKYGCEICHGSEIETTWYNFDALNVVKNHPARNMQDTFYLNGKESEGGENYLLRTHTTAVDIKTLSERNLPFKCAAFGKTFRRDMDKTHSPMFHQVDFLHVAKDVNISDLKAVLIFFLKEFFCTENIAIRMRPSFFPFTEPSMEVDIRYTLKNGKIIPDANGESYMEILGCGVLRPVVLKNCGVDAEKYVGIAAGIGVERMAMLKYGIEDIRTFYQSDAKWLDSHFFVNNI